MNVLPTEQTAPWESDCRRCRVRVIGAFGADGSAVRVEAAPVYGGDVELRRLEVGFRALVVTAAGDVERYVRHECANPEPRRPKPAEPVGADRMLMPFGKHRGVHLADVPRGYLRWAVENLEFRDPALKRAMELVLTKQEETRR